MAQNLSTAPKWADISICLPREIPSGRPDLQIAAIETICAALADSANIFKPSNIDYYQRQMNDHALLASLTAEHPLREKMISVVYAAHRIGVGIAFERLCSGNAEKGVIRQTERYLRSCNDQNGVLPEDESWLRILKDFYKRHWQLDWLGKDNLLQKARFAKNEADFAYSVHLGRLTPPVSILPLVVAKPKAAIKPVLSDTSAISITVVARPHRPTKAQLYVRARTRGLKLGQALRYAELKQ